jgi:hypothetical protein
VLLLHRMSPEKILGRVSDAGRSRNGAASSAAGVRKPPMKETALMGTEGGAAGAMGNWALRAMGLILI